MGQSKEYAVRRVAQLRDAGWDRRSIDQLPRPPDLIGVRILQEFAGMERRDARIRQAVQAAPAGGVLSGWAAAALHGVPELFIDGTRDGVTALPVEFSVPREGGTYRRRGVGVRYSLVPRDDVVQLDGIPVTSTWRTTLDLARRSRTEGRALAMSDLSMRHGLVEPATFADYVRPLKGLHGLKRVRAVMGEMCGQAESVPESELRWTWLSCELPKPIPNVSVWDRFGRFVGRIDLLDPESGLGAEYQGYWHHMDGAAENDENRFAKFAAMNLTIVPVWKEDVAKESVGQLLRQGQRQAQARDRRLDTWSIVSPHTKEPFEPHSP